MNVPNFEKVPVITRLIYALVSALFTTFLSYLLYVLFDMEDYDLGYYVFFFVAMFIFGFFSAGYSVKKKKK
jgi:hypothetical protein